MPVEREIFRDNDIRGIYPEQLDEGVMYRLALVLSDIYQPKSVSVGRDMRLSGPWLSRALIDGFVRAGVKVFDLGMITTPMNYFAAKELKVDLACIVSSSHNPKEYNGLIIAKDKGRATEKDDLEQLAKGMMGEVHLKEKVKGKVVSKQIMNRWMDHVFSLVNPRAIRPMKVVFDAGNSVAGIELVEALNRLPQIKAVKMFFEPDGSFPNHLPNPLLSATLKGLSKRVREEKADCGFSYDGDADRVIMVDEKGRVVEGSLMTAYLAKYLLEHRKYTTRPKMLYTSVMSQIVPKKISEYGGTPLLAPVGHSLIKAMMRKNRAMFAGEHSGHFYFKENNYNDSALVGTLILLTAISSDERPVSKQVEEFRIYEKAEEMSVKVDDRDRFIEMVLQVITSDQSSLGKPKQIRRTDGITVEYGDFWFNLRPSGTEPVVRFNIEAYEVGKLERRRGQVLSMLKKLGGHV